MNIAPFPAIEIPATEATETPFRAVFEHSPIAAARCNAQGLIVESNRVFQRISNHGPSHNTSLLISDLVPATGRERAESLLRELFNAERDSFIVEADFPGLRERGATLNIWRQSGCGGETQVIFLVEDKAAAEFSLERSQTQRWEAVGRLTGGVVHDFNNLLTGVMLYCDLLLSTLDSRDCRRRYADEIRSAIMQAAGLVQQLLVFARPQATPSRALNLNEVAESMRDLLARLIGEHIELELRLDPELGAVNIDRAQAQQILLNLVLNARDAMPGGGRITIESSNCRFQPMAGAISGKSQTQAFPCVLLAVADNGEGMTAETRLRLFEPFFTTKNAGKGTGLGLTTVRSIVTTNRGLIHFESEQGRGTRVMILLPRALASADTPTDPPSPPVNQFQPMKKESLL